MMKTTLSPTTDYRFAFKKGMKGTDVAALQLNLDGAVIDGVYGSGTERKVREFQDQNGLEVDGIAGLMTQRAMCRIKCGPVQKKFSLPQGILISIINNESGFAVAAVGMHSDKEGFDLGAFQKSTPVSASQGEIATAYRVGIQAELAARRLRDTHDRFSKPVESWYLQNIGEGNRGRFAWQLAILSHNWPVASENIAKHGAIFKDDPAGDNDRQEWIVQASGGRLFTSREWVVSYIQRATVFVNWPS